MTEPAPSRAKAPPSPKPPRSHPPRSAEAEGPRVLVRYYHKMRLQRVYPVRVEWQLPPGTPAQPAPPPVVIRPVIPGALVTPARLTLDAAPDTDSVFYVTPLARGSIADARVEVVPPQGQPVEITLPIKVVSQRLTKVLLLLTVLLPALLLYFTKYGKLKGDIALESDQARDRRATPNQAAPNRPAPNRPGPNRPPPNPAARRPADPESTSAGLRRGMPGELLALRIKRNVPQIPYVTDNVADALGEAYEFLCALSEDYPLSFYVGVLLLVLTGTSWLAHLSARGRRRSKPLVLTGPAPLRQSPPSTSSAADEAVEATMVDPGAGR